MDNKYSAQQRIGLSVLRKTQQFAGKSFSDGDGWRFGPIMRWGGGLGAALCLVVSVSAQTFFFSTGNPDGRMATASRPGAPGKVEIESADDFNLLTPVSISHATFTGLLPRGLPLSDVGQVVVEIYRVFPIDSVNPPDGRVPTRVNSPSDNASFTRDSGGSTLTFSTTLLNPNFTAANSVLNGINAIPNFQTGGEGAVTGQEVLFNVNFTDQLDLAADHYFFVPQVKLTSGDFLWLSSGTPVTPDLQSWIRNGPLDPDWLRVGTDIVGGTTAPKFNDAFSLDGTVPDATSTVGLLALAMFVVVRFTHRWRIAG